MLEGNQGGEDDDEPRELCRAAPQGAAVPGHDQPDGAGVRPIGPSIRGSVRPADGRVVSGWQAADRETVQYVRELSAADPRGPAALHHGLPEDECAAGGAGAALWPAPEQGQSVDPYA